jgi:hypothetical protein
MRKTIFATQIGDFKSTDVEGVGNLRWERQNSNDPLAQGQGLKCYLWVYNGTTTTLTPGQAMYHGTAAFNLTTGINPTNFLEEIFTFGQASKGTAINLLAGIAVSACPAGQYCWIQVWGYNSLVSVEGTAAVAATDNLKGVSGQTYLVKDTAAGTAPTVGRRTVIALAAKAGAGIAATAAFIQCL